MISISNREGSVRFEKKGLSWWVICRGLFHDGIGCAENRTEHSGLRSAEHSKNIKSFKNKIHYITMILYLNYKNNVYKVENVNEGGGR